LNLDVDFRFGYTGRERDEETGLYYYRARYYDAAVGEFVSEDPIGFEAGDYNLTRYVSGDPINWIDPSGTVATFDRAVMDPGSGGSGIGGASSFNSSFTFKPGASRPEIMRPVGQPYGAGYNNSLKPTNSFNVARPSVNRGEPSVPSATRNPSLPSADRLTKYYKNIPSYNSIEPNPVEPKADRDPNRCKERNKKKKECYPGYIEGGSYYQVRAYNLGGQANHAPAWNAIEQSGIMLGKLHKVSIQYRKDRDPVEQSDGFLIAPAICMSSKDHRRTITYGVGKEKIGVMARSSQATLISQGRFLDALTLDTDQINRLFPGKYAKGIGQMRSYTMRLVSKHPELFRRQYLLPGER
jgi:RHS repeat-associated protein